MKKHIKILAISMAAIIIGVFGSMIITESITAQAAIVRAGSSRTDVKKVQQKLKDLGYTITVDGIYGSRTTYVVKSFQRSNKLTADGIVGPKTLKALGITVGSSGGGGSSNTNSDTYLLAKCIYAEARGEPYIGKVAVGAVILNRVKHPDFPNSIAGVIYQPYAFTAVSDGQINLNPDADAMKAAQDALNGWDPSYGCIYYYNPAVATSKWIFSRKTVTTIGKHVFAV